MVNGRRMKQSTVSTRRPWNARGRQVEKNHTQPKSEARKQYDDKQSISSGQHPADCSSIFVGQPAFIWLGRAERRARRQDCLAGLPGRITRPTSSPPGSKIAVMVAVNRLGMMLRLGQFAHESVLREEAKATISGS